MEVLLGITGKDFTLIAASKAAMRGPTVLKAADDKTRELNKHTLMAFSGEAGDTVQFAEYIQANVQLYSMRNETELSPSAVANFVRGELSRSLRSRRPYTVNLLLGGVDPITEKPSLYWLDYLAALAPVPYAAHGYAQYVEQLAFTFPPRFCSWGVLWNRSNKLRVELLFDDTPDTTAYRSSINTTTQISLLSKV